MADLFHSGDIFWSVRKLNPDRRIFEAKPPWIAGPTHRFQCPEPQQISEAFARIADLIVLGYIKAVRWPRTPKAFGIARTPHWYFKDCLVYALQMEPN